MIKLESKPLKKWEFREYKKGGLLENGIALNETGIMIYKLCDGKNSIEQIADKVYEIYKVDQNKAKTDTINCVKSLFEEEVISII